MKKITKKARTDLQGVVRVTVALENGDGERVKGNKVRSFRVGAATVSAVADALERSFERPDMFKLKQ